MIKTAIHLTSVHQRYDTRIFIKMCSSLALHNYKTILIVADGKGDEVKNGVTILDVGKPNTSRIYRMTFLTRRIYKKALSLNGDIYHLHDPELIPIGVKLKKATKHVVFDAHEDYPQQVLAKEYLNKYVKLFLSYSIKSYENWACKKFDAVVTATSHIKDKFLKTNPQSIDINNFPILDELTKTAGNCEKENAICYIGTITKARGILETVSAMAYTKNTRLNLGGNFAEKPTEDLAKKDPNWDKVNELGFLSREAMTETLARSKAGLVVLHPIINYLDALPVKMFEYMAAGLPVIASDFPLWREIIEDAECGICIDPLKPKEIAKAINFLIENPETAELMGKKGQQAANRKYNWKKEEEKLLNLYSEILSHNSKSSFAA